MRRASWIGVMAVAGVGACTDRPAGPDQQALLEGPSISVRATALTLDDRFVNVTREVPGFAGMYLDGSGVVVLRATGDLDRDALADALDRQGPLNGLGNQLRVANGSGRVRVEVAAYDFVQLKEWHDAILRDRPEGLVWVDVDEVENRIGIGLTGAQTDATRRALRAAGVPERAVGIEEHVTVQLTSDLDDYVRPLVGGLRVVGPDGGCTLMINGTASGTPGFLTNSHCTEWYAGWDGNSPAYYFYQGGYAVGFEMLDPAPRPASQCPGGSRPCRLGDWAFIANFNQQIGTKGAIARTTGYNSTTIDPWDPQFEAAATLQEYSVGQPLNGMGQVSGWTSGVITHTCLTYAAPELSYTDLVCQNRASVGGTNGDSGSPIFVWNSSMGNTALLTGILWGMVNGDIIYSPYSAIYNEAVYAGYFLDVSYGEEEEFPCDGQCFPM